MRLIRLFDKIIFFNNRMNLKQFLNKNAFNILIGAIICVIIVIYFTYKHKEGFNKACTRDK